MSRSSRNKHTGFTLIEVMVTVAIVVVLMSIIFSSQATYSESTILNNALTDISIAVRSVQVYGISVKEARTGSNDFSGRYGIEFSKSTGSNTGYISFVDIINKDFLYDNDWSCPTDAASECISKTTFNGNLAITQVCELDLVNAMPDCTPSKVDITFVRPDSNAHITFRDASGSTYAFPNVKGARIDITSPVSNITRSVTIYTTGQISLQ